MDGLTGHIEDVEAFHSDNDDQAVAQAKSKQGPSPMEVWSLHRKVARLEASDPGGFTVERFLQADLPVQPESLGNDDDGKAPPPLWTRRGVRSRSWRA